MSTTHEHEPIDHSSPARYAASVRVTLVSVIANLVLTVSQLIIGFIGNSQALMADGLHTLSDLITDFLVLFALRHGRKEADVEHPYGHARIETAVTMILGVMLFAVGVGIAVTGGLKLVASAPVVTPSAITLWVAVFTLAAKEGLYRYTLHTARRFDSNMLRANAWHHRSDAVSSLVVVVGIAGSLVGLPYLDLVAAIVVAIMIIKVGLELAWQSLRELVDTGLDPEELESIRETIAKVGGVKALHLLRTRRVGGKALVDVHVIVDEKLSVSEGHQISETVRAALIREIDPVMDVMVHIDTEEDVEGPTCDHLPSRAEVMMRLDQYFREAPEVRAAERVTLHYLRGGIEVEILLPLAVAPSATQAQALQRRLTSATKGDPDIRSVVVTFY